MCRETMRAVCSAILGFALVLNGGCAPSSSAPPPRREAGRSPGPTERRARLRERVEDWAFAIGDGCLEERDRLAAYDLVIVDGEEASREDIALLHEAGCVVVAYLSVGTIEDWRWWYPKVREAELERWEEWDERYADVSDPVYRRVILGEVAPWMLDKGFDGLFLDNTDMVEEHPDQVDGMRELVRGLDGLVHGRDGYLMTQNGENALGPTLAAYDAWNREGVTFDYSFEKERYVRVPARETRRAIESLRRLGGAGLLTLSTDYTSGGDPELAEAIANARKAGALPYVSDIDLARVPAPTPR